MDEFLFRFSTEDDDEPAMSYFCAKEVKILSMTTEGDSFKIKVQGKGETFDLKKHEQGTEVKAITYSNMQIHRDKPTNDIYVIVDI
jgi:SHS2 domain-containing protein